MSGINIQHQEVLAYASAGAESRHVEVAVPKAKLVSTFKALVALKQQIGFQTSKKDITLQPSGYVLQTVMWHLVIQMLQEQGWHSFQPNLFLCKSNLKSICMPMCNVLHTAP